MLFVLRITWKARGSKQYFGVSLGLWAVPFTKSCNLSSLIQNGSSTQDHRNAKSTQVWGLSSLALHVAFKFVVPRRSIRV